MMVEFLVHMVYFGGIPNGIIMIIIAWMARDLGAMFSSVGKRRKKLFFRSIYNLYAILIAISLACAIMGYVGYVEISVNSNSEGEYVDKFSLVMAVLFYYLTVVINILIGSWLVPLYLWKRFRVKQISSLQMES